MVDYLPALGDLVVPTSLDVQKARQLALALASGQLPFVRLVECRRRTTASGAVEAVVIDVDVEVPQAKANDIQRVERISAEFEAADTAMPAVLALRSDFPLVPHLILRETEVPRSLCLYEQPYSELRLRWTPVGFVERIREWLALTATGTLHQGDQYLEPLLPGGELPLVIPWELLDQYRGKELQPIYLKATSDGRNVRALVAQMTPQADVDEGASRHAAVVLWGSPQAHGIISRSPATLLQLHEFLRPAGIDLLGQIRSSLASWQVDSTDRKLLESNLVIVVVLPKIRTAGSEEESYDLWAFRTGATLAAVGEAIGIWSRQGGKLGRLLPADETRNGDQVAVTLLQVLLSFSQPLAALYSGLKGPDRRKIVAVGVGALGSQVFMNLVRMGIGEWTLVDGDLLFPHNLARHELPGLFLMHPKADALVFLANGTFSDGPVAASIVTDVLSPAEADRERLNAALEQADVILDMSASVAVARHLARDVASKARRISAFISPSGRDLVVLAEDEARRFPLDYLEMCYYREVLHNPDLRDHLRSDEGTRYGQSCRDVSSRIPQDLVALQAALGARALRSFLDSSGAAIGIWRLRDDDISVQSLRIAPPDVVQVGVGEWTIVFDKWLLGKVWVARSRKLPSETGGVLVGSFDMTRRVAYVVDTLDSPTDSTETPSGYVRGTAGVLPRLEEIAAATSGMLQYAGEWHSHPPGHGAGLSSDDRNVLAWVTEGMRVDAKPGIVMVEGEANTCAWYLDQVFPDESPSK